MRSGFERALDDCLEAVRTGATDIERLLSQHPRYAHRLRPLLEAAVELRGEPPRPREKARGLARLQAALVVEQKQPARPAAAALRLGWATRGSLFVAAALLSLAAIASGVAAASSRVREFIVPSPVHDFFSSNKEPARMQGVIRRVGDGSIVVESQREERNVRFSDDTKIVDGRGTPAPETTLVPGQQVTVAGELRPDNSFQAQQVQVHSDDDRGVTLPPSATPSPLPGRRAGGQSEVPRETDDDRSPTSTPTTGSGRSSDDERRPSAPAAAVTPVPTATESPSPTHAPDEQETSFTGVVTSRTAGALVVSSGGRARAVVVDSSTRIEGDLTVGAKVRVRGTVQADGSVLAREVDVLEDAGDSEGSEPTPKPDDGRARSSEGTASPSPDRRERDTAAEPTPQPDARREGASPEQG